MFTGIVEARGELLGRRRSGDGAVLSIHTHLDLSDVVVGDSIAVNGVCLTATSLQDAHTFTADASHETLARTTLGELRPGQMVNLERALRLGDRLGGHIVQGHVDGTGQVQRVVPHRGATDWYFLCPDALMDAIVEKGSICIDGISLTVNGVSPQGFHVTIIPHTAQQTTLEHRRPGDRVNLETDVVGKYIVSLARRGRLRDGGELTLDTLKEHGFS